jgi:hypothetical protein
MSHRSFWDKFAKSVRCAGLRGSDNFTHQLHGLQELIIDVEQVTRREMLQDRHAFRSLDVRYAFRRPRALKVFRTCNLGAPHAGGGVFSDSHASNSCINCFSERNSQFFVIVE